MHYTPRFLLGWIIATPAALAALDKARKSPIHYLERHQQGDWGGLTPEDAQDNELSLLYGLRLLSAYILPTGVKIWIITERDRSATTILLPEEY